MTTTAGPNNIFKRINVSEHIIKRCPDTKNDRVNGMNEKRNGIPMHVTNSSKAALEKILLRVPLTDDVASFSDNDSKSGTSLYSDDQPNISSVCLPSSGYKSAPEGGKYQIRTSNKAQKLTSNGVVGGVRRTTSLRTSSVTDRLLMFGERSSRKNSTENTTTTTAGDDTTNCRNTKHDDTRKSNLLGCINKWNNTIGGSKPSPNTNQSEKDNKSDTNTSRLEQVRQNSFNKIHDAWKLRKSNDDDSNDDNEKNIENTRTRRVSRRRRDVIRDVYMKHLCDKSDSETEPEDGQNRRIPFRSKRGRDKGAGEENNNETSSDKTHDSGIFDLCVSISEDMIRLSKRYDSKEYLDDAISLKSGSKEYLDDAMSLKSGYSSATDSLAESIADSVTTTACDSNDEQLCDGNKSRVGHKNKTKSIISNMNKIAVTNATSNTNNIPKLTNNNPQSHIHSLNSNTQNQTSILRRHSDLLPLEGGTSAGKNKWEDARNVNTELNSETKTNTTSDRRVKTSFNKNLNLPNNIPLASKKVKECKQLKSNTSVLPNNSKSNEAESMIELHNTDDRKNNSIVVEANSRNKDNEDIDHLNRPRVDKKLSLKTTSEGGDAKVSNEPNIPSRDTLKNVNNSPSSTQHRCLLADNVGRRDESDGSSTKHNVMLDTKVNINDKKSADKEHSSPNKDDTHTTKKTSPLHLNRNSARKQDSTELSLLPTRKSEPLKLEKKSRTPDYKRYAAETLNKAVQCVLLPPDVGVSNIDTIPKQCELIESIVHTDAIDILGQEILEEIRFKYPTDFALSETLERDERCNEGEEIVLSEQLKMDNARLQNLLFEVERARSGTIKALLHVNSLLNKVQCDNAKLKSDIEVSLKEKEALIENLKEIKDQSKPVHAKVNSSSTPGERWKRDKLELMTQLDKSRTKAEEAERELSKLRNQYKKVKEQLEHSNNAFTTTLKNNLDATKRLQLELRNSLHEKEELLSKCNEGNRLKRELEVERAKMEEMEHSHEELQDEKELLEQKIKHLEKKKQQLLEEQDELQEQISHSQEIIEKLSDAEEALTDRLEKEVKEKEYLQECLEETGQILYQLKINERRLLEDKHVLQYTLETEAEEKETLQTTLSQTKTEHQELIDRLQNMTNIHLTVKESLQLANKKEKNYQEQIEALTKTNHILYYTLEKEKEERTDLQEMLDIINLNYMSFKDQTVGKERDSEKRVEKIAYENRKLSELNQSLEKKCNELKADMEREEESKQLLKERLAELESVKEEVELSMKSMRTQQIENEKKMSHSLKVRQDLEDHLKIEREKVAKLTQNLEQTKKMLQQVDVELTEARKKLEQFKGNQNNLESRAKESKTRLKELQRTIQDLTEERDKYCNRMNYYETETKQLRLTLNEQTEQIGALQIGTQRLTRERDKVKRNFEMSLVDFESHKTKCGETLKRLKNEVIELSSKLVEKSKIAMKNREEIDNTKSDLEVLRKILDTDINITVTNMANNLEENSTDIEKLNLQILRDTHDKFRSEFQSHVEKLEDMLKESRTCSESITVVQSPMSKIKLEEIKFLRSETFELHTDVTSVKGKINKLAHEVCDGNVATPKGGDGTLNKTNRQLDLEAQFSRLNELVSKIECRHQAVMDQNAMLLEKTLIEDDVTAKDLVKKFQLVSLQGENRQLKTFVGLLQKKYKFNEKDLKDELNIVSAGDKISMSELLTIANQISTNSNEALSDTGGETRPETVSTPNESSSLNEQYVHSQSRRNKTYNFFNKILSSSDNTPSPNNLSPRSYTKHTSATTSEEDVLRLPRRYNSVPKRWKRPRSSYS